MPRDPRAQHRHLSSQHTLLVPRAASAGELFCGLCWPCWFYLPLGNCPGETVFVPTPTMVARAGQRRATSLWLAALPLTTKLAYELPNTLLVRRTSSTRELRLQALLPMTTSLAYERPHTHFWSLVSAAAGSTVSATCRWASVLASLPLDHPAQWSRGLGTKATSLLLALRALRALLLAAGQLSWRACRWTTPHNGREDRAT